MRALLVLLLAVQALALPAHRADRFAFFAPTVTLSDRDRASLERGHPLVSVLEASGQTLGAFTAIRLEPEVTIDRVDAWMRRIEALRQNRYVLASRRFSTPPRLEDLDELTLDEQDLQDTRRCSPGHCGVKLSAAEMLELKRVAAADRVAWRADVQHAFRQIVMRRVLAYTRRGHAGLDAYWDHRRPVAPGAAFTQLVKSSGFLAERAPDLARWLTSCPAHPSPDAASFLYWSKERLGGKAVISVTHAVLLSGDGTTRPQLLSVGIQVFATHYLNASISLAVFLRNEASPHGYFAYLQSSDVDILGGFWGSIARSILEGRIRQDGPAILQHVGARLANGEPGPAQEGSSARSPRSP